MAFGPQLLGDGPREHLIQQQRVAHGLPGEQAAFTPPRFLGGFLGRLSGGYVGINFPV